MGMKPTVYCEKCHDVLETYVVEQAPMKNTLKGKEYSYIGKIARCPVCGEEVWVPEIEKYNKEQIYSVYRKENGIISLEDVKALPEMYHISKRDLSKILGWGEITFTRFYEGYIPSRQYSDVLKSIAESSDIYYDFLYRYVQNNPVDKSVVRSLTAFLSQNNSENDFSGNVDVQDVAMYILQKLGRVTAMKLEKLIYYCQAWCLVLSEKPLFQARIEAWVNGPVVPELFKRHRRSYYVEMKQLHGDAGNIDGKNIKIIDAVLSEYGNMSAEELVKLSHGEVPWMDARIGLLPDENCHRVISWSSMADYYSYKELGGKNLSDKK